MAERESLGVEMHCLHFDLSGENDDSQYRGIYRKGSLGCVGVGW